jgi:hypothetical protein
MSESSASMRFICVRAVRTRSRHHCSLSTRGHGATMEYLFSSTTVFGAFAHPTMIPIE